MKKEKKTENHKRVQQEKKPGTSPLLGICKRIQPLIPRTPCQLCKGRWSWTHLQGVVFGLAGGTLLAAEYRPGSALVAGSLFRVVLLDRASRANRSGIGGVFHVLLLVYPKRKKSDASRKSESGNTYQLFPTMLTPLASAIR